MYTALFYYGYSDRTPGQWDIAIDRNTSKSRFKLDYPYVRPHYMEPQHLAYGITTADYNGSEIKIFDRDRLICECMVYENKLDREIFIKAVQAYTSDPKKRISKLLEYAQVRRVNKKVKDRVGIWL